jgi:nucleoside-diphosphate-sugar epimerase
MIYRDGLIGVIIAMLQRQRAGEIYNAGDDEPVRQLSLFAWMAGTLRRDLPHAATAGATTSRRRGLTNNKVSNHKLKHELGYQFKYPNCRTGCAAEIQRLVKPAG